MQLSLQYKNNFQICLFDEFKDNEYSNIKNLVSSTSFKQFVDNV